MNAEREQQGFPAERTKWPGLDAPPPEDRDAPPEDSRPWEVEPRPEETGEPERIPVPAQPEEPEASSPEPSPVPARPEPEQPRPNRYGPSGGGTRPRIKGEQNNGHIHPRHHKKFASRRYGRRRRSHPWLVILLMVAAVVLGWKGAIWYLEEPHQTKQPDSGFNDRSDLPGDDAWNYTQEEKRENKATLPAYTGARTSLNLQLYSREGMNPLSYQQLYERCLPTTVSIAVENQDGSGSGSGVVLTQDGYILTCAHVVEDEESGTVTTQDGKEYPAQLVGSDPQTDLALLKINATGLTPAQFGQSDQLAVGDEVLAIGDPLGPRFHGTLTNGIVSAINRDVTLNGYSMTLIQTTAALNSGNSGGPLVNIYGQVVGINNMKMVSTSTTVEGLGFAVPSATVQEIIRTLATDGGVSRPILGITCYGLNETDAAKEKMPSGIVVTKVVSASDCARQGLRANDVITAVDGQHFTTVAELKAYLSKMSIGQQLTLTVQRPKMPPEEGTADGSAEPVEYQAIGDLTVRIVDQRDLY